MPMNPDHLKEAQDMAAKVTTALGGAGIWGVEFFITAEGAYFSELSPRPHDTGMVTLISQDLSEFALHARAILGLPIPNIHFHGPSASAVILVQGESLQAAFSNFHQALSQPNTSVKLFGKPAVSGRRRMGVALARADSVEAATSRAIRVASAIKVTL